MTPLETLKAARQLISDPAKWTNSYYARDSIGIDVSPSSDKAVCFCSIGAIRKFSEVLSEAEMFLLGFCSETHDTYAEEFNDTHTHAEVLALFDAAIAELEGCDARYKHQSR